MFTQVVDQQVVPLVDGVLFSLTQQAPLGALVSMTNTGTNTMNYHFQEFNGNAWNDMASLGTPLNNTLTGGQSVAVAVVSGYPQVRLMGFTAGAANIEFAVDRYVERSSGGSIPIISL